MSSSPFATPLSVTVILVLATGCASGNPRVAPAREDATVTAADIEDSSEPIEKVLQKKAPGLVIKRGDDGSLVMQIRGSTPFNRDDAPLYLVDGMPFQPGPEGVLSGVDPYNIESIRVLRGADAAIYGIQGANGVIEISTKRGVKRVR